MSELRKTRTSMCKQQITDLGPVITSTRAQWSYKGPVHTKRYTYN